MIILKCEKCGKAMGYKDGISICNDCIEDESLTELAEVLYNFKEGMSILNIKENIKSWLLARE